MFNTGHILSERYEIMNSIGEGGMANVYLAFDMILQRNVAIKVLRGDLSGDELFVKRFRREALASTSLNHPNIVQIYDVGDEDGKYYIVMEYVEGITLKQLLLKRKRLNISEVVDISKQIIKGLEHAHSKHIVHRDIKPHNILVQRDGTVKITDFGIAVTLNETILTQTNSILGSVHYLPPEQINGNVADIKSDIYSTGVLMYEMITGELPFTGDSAVTIALMHVKNRFPSVRDIDPTIPQSIDNIIIRATAKNPKNRFTNAEEMLRDLRDFRLNKNDNRLVLDDQMEEKTINLLLNNSDDVEYTPKQTKSNRSKMLAIIVALITLLIAVTSFIIYIISKPELVTVPNVIGMSRGEATEALVEKGFEVSSDVTFVESDEFDNDEVISISEKAGTEKPVGFKIVMTVSTGPAKYIMEDFVGKNIDEIKSKLEDQGFTVSIQEKVSAEITDYSIVIEQVPVVGTEVSQGEIVVLYKAKEQELFPNMLTNGFKKEEIDSFCRQYSLQCYIDYAYDDTVAEGLVISQSIEEGEFIENGSTLSIVLSKGVDPSTQVPDEEENSESNQETTQPEENTDTSNE